MEDLCWIFLPKFKDAAIKVWGKLDDRMTIGCELKTDKSQNLASLSIPGGCRPMAMNGETHGFLLYFCREYILQVTPRLLELTEEQQEKIMKHEAIHMGFMNHGKDFFELAEKVGAPFSESNLTNKIRIQAKFGSRYENVGEAETLGEAKIKVKEYLESHPDCKGLRTQF